MPGREVDNGFTQQDMAAAVSAQGSRWVWLAEGGVGVGRDSYVRMYMHEGCVSGISLEDFPLLSLAYEEHFLKSEWNRHILCLWSNPYVLIS